MPTGLPSYLSPYQQTYLGVEIVDEGCGEEFVRFGRSSGWRQFTCSWLDRLTLINNLGAYAGINIANQYQYFDAVSYPDAPTVLYFESIKTTGIPIGGLNVGPNGMVGYALSRNVITFKTNPYLELEQGTLAISYANTDVGLPKNLTTYYFGGVTSTPPVDSSQIPSIQITMVSYVWEAFNLVSIPTATISAAAKNPIDQSGLFGTSTANGGTLRLMSVDTDRRVAQNGQEMWSMKTTLVENPAGWNCVFQPYIWNNNSGSDSFVEVMDEAGNPPQGLDNAGNIPALLGNANY